jgi:hypothetical protein
MQNPTTSSERDTSGGVHQQIERFLQTAMKGMMRNQDQAKTAEKAGRHVSLPSLSLWMAVLVGVLRGFKSQRAIWRLIAAGGWWDLPCYDVGDQAVYKRLEQEGWKPLAEVFTHVSVLLAQWLQPALHASLQQHRMLAPFASDVVALDEMYLDQVSRRLPVLRPFKKGAVELLPGKMVALFDVRLQQWRTLQYIAQAKENGLEQAKALLACLKPGTLVLADLGYFGYRWFDELTQHGYSWISRVKGNTSVVVLHTYYEAGDTFDRLIWLGAWNTLGTYAVRQVQFSQGGVLRQYVTNVCNPMVLPLPEIARLYARRWDIELAFLTLKRELGLHVIWSSKSVVVLAQVWACLIIAQILQAIRMEVALRADVDPFDVSLPLLIEAFPQFGSQGRDGIAECVRQGCRLGILRPSTRLRIQAPEISEDLLIPVPGNTPLCREPHGSGKNRTTTPAPADQQSNTNRHAHPDIEVHPQRDQIVAILMQREARLKATMHHAREKPAATSKHVPLTTEATMVSARRTVVRPLSVAHPHPSSGLPPWTFLQPFVASAS